MQREILEFTWHPEHKSLSPNGQPCNRFTRGLLQRTPIIAGELIPVGKETDRKWEDGEDISILDHSMIQYLPKKIKADQKTKEWIRNYGIKRCSRETNVDRNTIRAWLDGKAIRRRIAKEILKLRNVESNNEKFNVLIPTQKAQAGKSKSMSTAR